MEKAVSHYNNKKQLLQESQEELTEIKQSLELKESQLQVAMTNNKVLQRDLDKAQTSEKKLLSLVANLEEQVSTVQSSCFYVFHLPFKSLIVIGLFVVLIFSWPLLIRN